MRYIFVPRLHWNADVCCTGMTLCEPSLSLANECCFPDQHACATRSSQLRYSFHTGTNLVTAFTWYRYGMWSAFIPERNFRTGTRTGVNSYRYDSYRCGISYRYHVNKYRATSGNRDVLVPEWQSYRYHVNTPWVQKVHSPNLLKRRSMSEVARICSIIILHLSKLWKAKFSILLMLYFWWGCRGNLTLITLGSERVNR